MMQATSPEYKYRFLIHAIIYILCFAAPWPDYSNGFHGVHPWSFMRNGSTWFRITDMLSRPLYQHFSQIWNGLLVLMVLFALAGAWFRVWGASYLGASTVHRSNMEGNRIVADGPFRYVRNPLYLGTILNTVALASLMRPDAAVLCIFLISLFQFRLIGREEPYLLSQLGEDYHAYISEVPRLLPSLHPRTTASAVRPNWKQGFLSEFFVVGSALSFAAVGWTNGYSWESSLLRVVQGILISLGLSIVLRAFLPKSAE